MTLTWVRAAGLAGVAALVGVGCGNALARSPNFAPPAGLHMPRSPAGGLHLSGRSARPPAYAGSGQRGGGRARVGSAGRASAGGMKGFDSVPRDPVAGDGTTRLPGGDVPSDPDVPLPNSGVPDDSGAP